MRVGASKTLIMLAGAAAAVGGAAQAGDWTVTLGGQVLATPSYEGAGHDVVLPVPSLAVQRAGQPERFAAPDDGFGIGLLGADWISVGPTVRFRGSRDDAGERAGLHRIGIAAEPGLFASVWPAPWLRLHVEQRKGVFGHHGWIGDAGLDAVARPGRWALSAGPRLGWGDQAYMSDYFGVTAAEAAASPVIHQTYQPQGGLRYAGALATLAYRFDSRWQAVGELGYDRLTSIAADSPIVRAFNARNEYIGGVGVKYSFDWSP